MKRYILFFMLMMGLITLAKAQKTPTATELATKSIDELDKRLKLNSTQKSIIYNYTLEMSKEQLGLLKKQQAGTYNEDDVSKFYKLQNENRSRIRNILKGDQQNEYDKYLEDQLNGSNKKKKNKKGKSSKEEEIVTGISGLKIQPQPN